MYYIWKRGYEAGSRVASWGVFLPNIRRKKAYVFGQHNYWLVSLVLGLLDISKGLLKKIGHATRETSKFKAWADETGIASLIDFRILC